MPIDLAGKPIVITGASSGIGHATALGCARADMPVAVMARRADRLELLASQIRGAGGRVLTHVGAVEDAAACATLVERCRAEFGSVYAVFANAGHSIEQSVEEMPDESLRRMFEVNFFGSLNVIRPALALMRGAGRGHVLWCSSCLSKVSLPRYAAYCATKACQDHFARALRLELRGSGIYCSSIHPVGTRTEIWDNIVRHSPGGASLIDRSRANGGHPPQRVASAVVSCLRRPRGEVWLSTPMRLVIALGVAAPGLADAVIERLARRRAER
ncbi:MAG: SDR family NAD(P)-dependent oxidoreductase [Phycisphaerales bacterium]|nr:SDR family NAD(P)-dependent oxidoreductase [Phycisphaerales bacterium]